MKYIISTCLLGLVFLFGCTDQSIIDDELLVEYMEANNLDAEKTEEGLYYVIERQGTGERPDLNSRIVAHYEGYFLDGEIFDSSYQRGRKLSIGLNQVILGWQIGLQKINEGGKIKLLIPSELGYGSRGASGGSVPPNTVLIFDIELFDVD